MSLIRPKGLADTEAAWQGRVMTPEHVMRSDSTLDPSIQRYMETLNTAGIETLEPSENGEGPGFSEPTVRFCGDRTEGFRAMAIACQHGFGLFTLRRTWVVIDGEPIGPYWELTFYDPPAEGDAED
ncbi:MAG: hypothetical protein ACYS0G_06060 [Planctomycetota bacterium]|jgi:hypothetical protein